jgi:hypothetical protein
MASEKVASTFVEIATFSAALAGVVFVIVGAVVSTVQARLAGNGSTVGAVLAGGSIALTAKVCAPSVRPGRDRGDAQSPKVAPSRLHWKVALATVVEKLKLASVVETIPSGPLSIIAVGRMKLVS